MRTSAVLYSALKAYFSIYYSHLAVLFLLSRARCVTANTIVRVFSCSFLEARLVLCGLGQAVEFL